MPIYDIFDSKDNRAREESYESSPQPEEQVSSSSRPTAAVRDRLFSTIAARLFFLLLLVADLLWAVYAVSLFTVVSILSLLTGLQLRFLRRASQHYWISVKRSLVCALSLFIALMSPAFGIMIACTYFLMYDKAGIEEVVPTSLQDQFREFFRTQE